MEFSEREISDLALFFAKRFESFEERAALCEAAGLAGHVQLTGEALAAWNDAVRVAVQRGRLDALVQRAVQRRPDDMNLAEMARVLGNGQRWKRRRWGLVAGLGVAACAAGMLLWSPWSPDAQTSTARAAAPEPPVAGADTPAAEPESLADAADDQPTEPEVVRAAAAVEPADIVPTTLVEEASPKEAAVSIPPSGPSQEPVAKQRAQGAKPRGAPLRCEGEPGQIIGYWYAGEESPGAAGSRYVVDGGINVRAAYPSRENGYDARSALVCTLGHGWELRLGHEPVFVSGGAYWVPLSADDIVVR